MGWRHRLLFKDQVCCEAKNHIMSDFEPASSSALYSLIGASCSALCTRRLAPPSKLEEALAQRHFSVCPPWVRCSQLLALHSLWAGWHALEQSGCRQLAHLRVSE